jgi:hypothetical protein
MASWTPSHKAVLIPPLRADTSVKRLGSSPVAAHYTETVEENRAVDIGVGMGAPFRRLSLGITENHGHFLAGKASLVHVLTASEIQYARP